MTVSCGVVAAIRVPLAIASRWRDDADRCAVGGIGWHSHATTATEQQRGADDKNDLTQSGVFHCSYLFLVSYFYALPWQGSLLFILQLGDQVILIKLVLFLMVFLMEKINLQCK